MINITFRKLTNNDSGEIFERLSSSDFDYIKYFHPFDFNKKTISKMLDRAKHDMFFGVVLKTEQEAYNDQLIGFYMLRGVDEGYLDPMYGVFVVSEYQRKGIARLTISHAECICRFYSYKRILLKVYIENTRARFLYESLGFSALKKNDPEDNMIILYKNL